jgi:putative lipoic acid-binding regulatory protein
VILDDNCKTKPDIEYPCEWGYKIIGKEKEALEASIIEIMQGRKYSTKDGNRSSKGKFISMNSRCLVESEEDRDSIFKAFLEHPAVKMVI